MWKISSLSQRNQRPTLALPDRSQAALARDQDPAVVTFRTANGQSSVDFRIPFQADQTSSGTTNGARYPRSSPRRQTLSEDFSGTDCWHSTSEFCGDPYLGEAAKGSIIPSEIPFLTLFTSRCDFVNSSVYQTTVFRTL